MSHPRPWYASRWVAITLLASASGFSLAPLPGVVHPAAAIQYSDGRIEFSYPLRLTDSYATRTTVGDSGVTYYLAIDFPAAAQESLAKIVISLDEGRDSTFRYRLNAIEVFQETPTGRVSVPLGELTQDPDTQALTINFDPPVPPGSPLTLALRPVRNPRFARVYLFGATAFPVGETVRPTFMGFARLSFYEREGFSPWR